MIGVEAFKLKAILFDIDDTLIPTTLYTARARKQAIDEMVDMMNVDGFKITHKKVQKTFKQVLQEFGPDHKHHFESLVEKLKIPDEMKSKYAAMAVEGYRQLRSSLKPYPQVTSTLLGLRRQGYGL